MFVFFFFAIKAELTALKFGFSQIKLGWNNGKLIINWQISLKLDSN